MKYFRMSYEEVVFKRSYLNIMLLNRSIPTFGSNEGIDMGHNNVTPNKNKPQSIKKSIHASDFFMDMMG